MCVISGVVICILSGVVYFRTGYMSMAVQMQITPNSARTGKSGKNMTLKAIAIPITANIYKSTRFTPLSLSTPPYS